MRTRTIETILRRLEKGESLRQIAARYNISNQKVWRIGDANGVYSVRSKGWSGSLMSNTAYPNKDKKKKPAKGNFTIVEKFTKLSKDE